MADGLPIGAITARDIADTPPVHLTSTDVADIADELAARRARAAIPVPKA